MGLKVCFMSSMSDRHQPQFMEDLSRKGFTFVWKHEPEFSFRKRLNWVGEIAYMNQDDWLIFVDAHDFVLLAETPQEVISTLEKLGDGPTYSADAECWPVAADVARYDEVQKGTPVASSYWRFVNGCGPAGRGHKINEAMTYLQAHHMLASDVMSDLSGIDQKAWTDTYLDGYGTLDYECRLTQSFHRFPESGIEWDGSRVHNRITGSTPCFAHLCGHSDNAWNALRGM